MGRQVVTRVSPPLTHRITSPRAAINTGFLCHTCQTGDQLYTPSWRPASAPPPPAARPPGAVLRIHNHSRLTDWNVLRSSAVVRVFLIYSLVAICVSLTVPHADLVSPSPSPSRRTATHPLSAPRANYHIPFPLNHPQRHCRQASRQPSCVLPSREEPSAASFIQIPAFRPTTVSAPPFPFCPAFACVLRFGNGQSVHGGRLVFKFLSKVGKFSTSMSISFLQG